MSVNYLMVPIVEVVRTVAPRYGMARDGYTLRSGAPSSLMVRLQGERRFRRLMIWQFSNAGTAFLKIKGIPYVVRDVPGYV